MNIKTAALAGLMSSTLLLMGCGGDDGSNPIQPDTSYTFSDGTTITNDGSGVVDSKLGATYIQEFLIEKNAQNTTPENIYSRLNVSGVEQAHLDGWTGKDKTITVLDHDFDGGDWHGRYVSDIAHMVAPGATVNEFDYRGLGDSAINIATFASDVITTSTGFVPIEVDADGGKKAYVDDFISDAEASSALITVAAQHSNWTGEREDSPGRTGRGGFTTCPNDATMTVANCNTWSIQGLDSDNVIYVGEIDSNNNIPLWSNQAGDANKNQFIVTSSDEITTSSNGEPSGNSYAAPRVAGAGLLVRHKFPNLTGTQTATVILQTADDLGAVGVDDVYGYGKLNVGKALAPVGNLH